MRIITWSRTTWRNIIRSLDLDVEPVGLTFVKVARLALTIRVGLARRRQTVSYVSIAEGKLQIEIKDPRKTSVDIRIAWKSITRSVEANWTVGIGVMPWRTQSVYLVLIRPAPAIMVRLGNTLGQLALFVWMTYRCFLWSVPLVVILSIGNVLNSN
jgi:hypothetical protein